MGDARRIQWAAVAIVAVAVVALVVMLVLQQRQYRADTVEARERYQQQQAEAASSSGGPGQSDQDPAAAALAEHTEAARAVVNGSEDVVISVLGDSTSNHPTEWVGLWGASLAEDSSVEVHPWNGDYGGWPEETWAWEPDGDAERSVTVWNASQRNGTPAFLVDRLDELQPEDPDLVIVSLGHWATAGQMDEGLPALLDDLAETLNANVPVVLTAQNPATGTMAETSEAVREVVRAEAEERSLPLIAVDRAFAEALGEGQGGQDPAPLMLDAIHPSESGSALWLEAVEEFFAQDIR